MNGTRVQRPLAEGTVLHRLWQVALSMAAFAVAAVLFLFPFVNASYEGRLARDLPRMPVFLEEGGSTAVARCHWRNEHLDYWYVDVITVGVLDASASPPPGLPNWPEPGQVFASEALLAREGSRRFLSRYGDVVGTVDVAGLADPGERLAYVGADPALMDPERSRLVGGFERKERGRPGDTGYLGSALYQQSRDGFWFGLALFGVAPALIMAVVVARLGGERRDRRLAVLTTLGASQIDRVRFLLREAWRPVAVGAVAATLLGGLATVTRWPLPFAHYTVVGPDLRSVLWLLPVLAVTGGVLVLAVVVVTHRVRRGAVFGTRPVPAPRRAPLWPLGALGVVIPTTYYGYMFFASSRPDISTMVAVSGAAISLLLVGSATSVLIMMLARALTAVSRRTSLPAGLIAGRDLASLSRPVIRATVAVSAAIVLATQLQVWMSVADSGYRAAQAQHQQNRGLSLLVDVPGHSRRVARMVEDLPSSIAALAIGVTDGGTQVVWGSCPAFEAVLGACPATGSEYDPDAVRLPQSRLWIEPGALLVRAPITTELPEVPSGAPPTSFESIALFATDGRQLSRDDIASLTLRYEQPQTAVEGPGDSALAGGLVDRDHGRWFGYGGALALVLVFLTAGFALTFEMTRIGRRFAPLSVLIGSSSFYYRLAAGVVGAPAVLAAASGLAVAATIVLAPTRPGQGGLMPTGLHVALGAMALALAVVISLVAGRVTATAAHVWVAAREED